MTDYPVLTVTTFLPFLGALIILFVAHERYTRWIALGTTLLTLTLSTPLYWSFEKSSSALQFIEMAEWIPNWNVSYGMGVDGISLPFIFL